ncbi:MAG: hypothetical protein EA377_06285 [Phycisphaerales bacterium]|nr:MAG: hypothetical protein EA377_06285 [Phycisphaerales bacterium]
MSRRDEICCNLPIGCDLFFRRHLRQRSPCAMLAHKEVFSMTHKKLIVFIAIASIFMISSIWTVAHWLEEIGLIAWAETIRAEFLTGTALAVIAVMLYLLPGSKQHTPHTPHAGHRDAWPFD